MKLMFQGTLEEQRWFKERLSCPNGVPCPRHKSQGVAPIDVNFDCTKCCFHTDISGPMKNVVFVDKFPIAVQSEDIVEWVQTYTAQQKHCEECTFYQGGTCYFDYHCPQDFKKGGKVNEQGER